MGSAAFPEFNPCLRVQGFGFLYTLSYFLDTLPAFLDILSCFLDTLRYFLDTLLSFMDTPFREADRIWKDPRVLARRC